jgi:RHS repeat-associated protein
MCEARNAAGAITAQYFLYGQSIGASNYYYAKDHLGSIRELSDSSGNVQAEYGYDPFGQTNMIQGSLASDFRYAGYYFHVPSGLNTTLHRAYKARVGRWISRDPIMERGGVNLFDYVRNNPISLTDPRGTSCAACSGTTVIPTPNPKKPNKQDDPFYCDRKCKSFQYCLERYNHCMEVCEQEGTQKWDDCNAHDSCEPKCGVPYSNPCWVECMWFCLNGNAPPKPGS